jgi:hypothetical protein
LFRYWSATDVIIDVEQVSSRALKKRLLRGMENVATQFSGLASVTGLAGGHKQPSIQWGRDPSITEIKRVPDSESSEGLTSMLA